MTFKLPPYLKWRDGRPRWEPGPRLRHAFKARDLKDESGEFLGLEAAIAAAMMLNDDVASWRAGVATSKAKGKISRKPTRTCNHLWQVYKESPAYLELATVTRRDYKSKIGIFLDAKLDDSGATFGSTMFAALAQSDIFAWWEEIYKSRGHTMANSTISAVRSMFSYAVMRGWSSINPARNLKLKKVAPRVVVWTPSEVEAFVAKADTMQLYGVADAVVIGLHTCQRQGDVLRLELMSTEAGRAKFKQGKTGARVSVPFSPALEQRVEAIKNRRRSAQVAEIKLIGELVRDSRGGRYSRESFGRDFRTVRDAVANDQIAAGVGEASILGRQYLDLRDTGITRLALAGCTVPEIRAISGHSLETIHKVLAHYLALDDRMADAAIERLKVWMQDEGIAI